MAGEDGTTKPNYLPAHKMPAWISSADLHAAIRDLAESGADKAACWDFTQAVYRLVKESQPQTEGHPRP